MNNIKKINNIAVLGGAFNPIHNGHLWIAQQIYELDYIDKVLIIPCSSNNYGKEVISDEHRINMCKLACKDFDFEVLSVEIDRNHKYTYETILFLKKYYDYNIHWIVGSDWANKLNTFKKYNFLKENCNFIIINRPMMFEKNSGIEQTIGLQLSSSNIRDRIKDNKIITGLLPISVERYIKKNSLYKG